MRLFFINLIIHLFIFFPVAVKWRFGTKILKVIRDNGLRLEPRVIKSKYGFKMIADPLDWIGSHLMLWKNYEAELSAIILKFVKPGSVFLDIGANVGYFTLLAAKTVGISGHVYSIEPSPVIRKELIRNLQLNNYENRISIYDIAAWNKTDDLIFNQGPLHHQGISSFRKLDEPLCQFKAHAMPLEQVVPYKDKKINFIKLDIEGAEYQALIGMKDIISECRPYMAMELTYKYLSQLGHSSADVLDLLIKEYKYKVYEYTYSGKFYEANLEKLRQETSEQFNIFLAPEEKKVI